MSSSKPTSSEASSPGPSQRGLLTSHRVVQFSGPDAATFLQGYLTCDTDKLAEQQAMPGAFTNLKGRVVANGWVWGTPTSVQMLISTDLTVVVGEFLKMYLNFAKTNLTAAPHPPLVDLGDTESGHKPTDAIQLGSGQILLRTGFSTPAANTAVPADLSSAWLAHAIEQREVLVTAATSGTLLPQMLGLTTLGAVSFDKGCYLGQEVVARAEHRGEVKRRLRKIGYVAEDVLSAGGALEDQGGKRVGVVINATAGSPIQASALIVSAVDELEGVLWSYAGTPVQLN